MMLTNYKDNTGCERECVVPESTEKRGAGRSCFNGYRLGRARMREEQCEGRYRTGSRRRRRSKQTYEAGKTSAYSIHGWV
jgi:hypothetical protein